MNVRSLIRHSTRSGKGSTRGDAAMSPSIANRSKHLLNDPRFEPSRSRMLNAMKANTKGMLAIHASRRRFRVDPNRSGFIGVGPTLCCVASSGSDSYSTDAVTLSTGPNARPTRLKSTRMHSILSLIAASRAPVIHPTARLFGALNHFDRLPGQERSHRCARRRKSATSS